MHLLELMAICVDSTDERIDILKNHILNS